MLASCLALPALAQEIPAADKDGANAHALTDAQHGTADASARAAATNAQARAEADLRVQGAANAQAHANSVPRTMPPPIATVSPDKQLTPKEKTGVAVARTWINKPQRPHLDGDGVVHFTSGKGQVFVVAAVDHITDISLSPGETIFMPFHVGDADSWKVHAANSRADGKPVSHILVKPTDAGLSTNIVIETNKRTISVALTSRQRDYMPLVSLDMAEDDDADMVAYANKLESPSAGQPVSACDQSPVVPPDQFSIEGDKASWRPIQVYQVSTPVGIKTCVDFPSSIGSTSLPALLALADDGGFFTGPTKTVVNVRFISRRFIVDEALNRFVLVDGVGGDQRKIKIIRKGL